MSITPDESTSGRTHLSSTPTHASERCTSMIATAAAASSRTAACAAPPALNSSRSCPMPAPAGAQLLEQLRLACQGALARAEHDGLAFLQVGGDVALRTDQRL